MGLDTPKTYRIFLHKNLRSPEFHTLEKFSLGIFFAFINVSLSNF